SSTPTGWSSGPNGCSLGRAGVELVRDRYSLDVCLPEMLRLYRAAAPAPPAVDKCGAAGPGEQHRPDPRAAAAHRFSSPPPEPSGGLRITVWMWSVPPCGAYSITTVGPCTRKYTALPLAVGPLHAKYVSPMLPLIAAIRAAAASGSTMFTQAPITSS